MFLFQFDQCPFFLSIFASILQKRCFLAASAGASIMLAELAMEAGLPKGVLNIVHGTHVRSY